MLHKQVVSEVEKKIITSYPRVLVVISKNQPITISDAQREAKITYSHMQTCIADLLKWEIVKKKKQGRIALLRTTDTGEKLAKHFQKILPMLKKIGKKTPSQRE